MRIIIFLRVEKINFCGGPGSVRSSLSRARGGAPAKLDIWKLYTRFFRRALREVVDVGESKKKITFVFFLDYCETRTRSGIQPGARLPANSGSGPIRRESFSTSIARLGLLNAQTANNEKRTNGKLPGYYVRYTFIDAPSWMYTTVALRSRTPSSRASSSSGGAPSLDVRTILCTRTPPRRSSLARVDYRSTWTNNSIESTDLTLEAISNLFHDQSVSHRGERAGALFDRSRHTIPGCVCRYKAHDETRESRRTSQ